MMGLKKNLGESSLGRLILSIEGRDLASESTEQERAKQRDETGVTGGS